jgi:ribosomal protein S18 acetylase RimI-like enzyme
LTSHLLGISNDSVSVLLGGNGLVWNVYCVYSCVFVLDYSDTVIIHRRNERLRTCSRDITLGCDAGGFLAESYCLKELRHHYDDWVAFSRHIGNMASLTETGELIVATVLEKVVGAVAYVGPGKKKREFFPLEWPILRMLVVAPAYRGLGIGRALTEECIRRAERDSAPLIALHTTPIMKVALPMYERMGFTYRHEAPNIFGVPYGIYVKELAAQHGAPGDAPKAARPSTLR